ncbi:MAG: glycosyl hydrolase family 2, partial [Bacteroidaceae bacterium]|nr:glycosyl hydrolase family 2 [Bacteroidaceae bacterium]
IPMERPKSWTELGDSYSKRMATGCYTTYFTAKRNKAFGDCRHILDLGDVRESARIVVNGKEVATLFAVPFRCDITPYVKKGKNKLQVYVTNLPANRIADMDRQGIEWRKFKEINVVDLNYKKNLYDTWKPVSSGLNGAVRLISYTVE